MIPHLYGVILIIEYDYISVCHSQEQHGNLKKKIKILRDNMVIYFF